MIHHTKLTDCTIHHSGWSAVPGTGVEVTSLPVIDTLYEVEGGPVFARLNYDEALAVAARFGARLLAPGRINDLRKPGVALQLLPYLGTPIAETELSHSERHDADVWRQLRVLGWDGKQPVVGAGKHWVAGAPPGRSRLEGWDRDGAGPGLALWQPDMVAHNRLHFDDGTTTVLERDVGADYEEPPATPPPAGRPPTVTIGDDGPAVGKWQALLNTGDKPIAWTTAKGTYRQWPDTWRWPIAIRGHFGPRTQAATECWQSRRGLVADAIVGAKTWAAALAEPSIPPPPDTLPAPPPSVESATGSWRVTPGVSVLDRIVFKQAKRENYRPGRLSGVPIWLMLHTAETVETSVVAENLQTWVAGSEPEVSWHYAVDDDSITQSVREEDIAYACPGFNDRSIHVELGGRAMQGRSGWADDYSVAVVRNAIALSRAILARHPVIRPVKINYIDLVEELPGICGHHDGTLALAEAKRCGLKRAPWWDSRPGKGWKTSTHVDPGPDWPWDEFLAAVRA